MSAKSELVGNFANSFGNMTDSAMDLAGKAISFQSNLKQKQDNQEQLTKSNQYRLKTSYQSGLNETLKTLPESIDFDSYKQRIQEFNNSFLSEARESGAYDNSALMWFENSFLPSQKIINDEVVEGVTNYAINAWVSKEANSYASVLAADPNLSVDEAYNQYGNYYDSIGLGTIENGRNAYGILTPMEFREAIRGEKATQSFARIASDPETGYLFSKDFDFGKAMKDAMAEAGYSPNLIQEASFMADCNAKLASIETEVKNAVDGFCEQIEGAYNQYLLSDQADSSFFDLSEAYEVAKTYPPQYLGKFFDFAAKVNGHNADVQYNVATSLIDKGVITDSTLAMLDAGYASTHAEKFMKARENAVTSQILKVAKANGNGDAGNILAYIYSGDVGITVTNEERFGAAQEFYKTLQSGYDTLSGFSELATKINADRIAGSPVPDILSALYDVEISYVEVGEDGEPETVTQTEAPNQVTENQYPANASFVFVPKYDFTFNYDSGDVPLAEKRISEEPAPQPEPETVTQAEQAPEPQPQPEPTPQTTPVATPVPTRDALPVIPQSANTVPTGAELYIPTVFTANALNKVTEQNAQAEVGNAQINNAEAQKDFLDMKRRGAPQEVLNAMARHYEQNGELSEEWLKANVGQADWRKDKNWSLIDAKIDDLAKDLDIGSGTIDVIKENVKDQLIEAFRYSGQTWDEFQPTITKLLDLISSTEMISMTTGQLSSFNYISEHADSYYQTMTANGTYGDVFADYASGKFDAIVDNGIIQSVQNQNIIGLDSIREQIAKEMGHASYKDAIAADPTGMTKLTIEAMTAVVNMHNEAGEFYDHVIERLKEYGIDAELLDFTIDKDLGYVFFDSNSVARGYALCIDPELMTYDKECGISAQWKYVYCRRGSDGKYVLDKSISGDMGAYAEVGSNLFVTTEKKPSEDLLSGAWASDVQTAYEISGWQSRIAGTTPIVDFSAIAKLFQTGKTRKYKKQAAEEEATFVDAYKTAFGLWEY